jgi:hypothetical protein
MAIGAVGFGIELHIVVATGAIELGMSFIKRQAGNRGVLEIRWVPAAMT